MLIAQRRILNGVLRCHRTLAVDERRCLQRRRRQDGVERIAGRPSGYGPADYARNVVNHILDPGFLS
jgi:hypothetical protein